MLRSIVLVLLLLAAPGAWAHEPSRSLLGFSVTGSKLSGRLDVSLRDLEDAVGLDADGDAIVTWGEVAAREPDIVAYVAPRLRVASERHDCPLAIAPNGIDTHGGATFAVLALAGVCDSPPAQLRVDYSLLFDIDRSHRVIVTVESAGSVGTAVISNDEQTYTAELQSQGALASLRRFVVEGVWHIWQGYDHLAFVVLLVLPILLGRDREKRTPSPRAAAGWVPIPTRVVELVIAASVLLAAVANVAPRVARLGPKLAFAFGLVHGFGFASALGTLTAGSAALLPTLAGFNLGVELGQLAIVAALFPLLLALRRSVALRDAVTFATSTACGALALVWLAERAAA